jgi:cell division GTPase FtsZ
VKTIRADAASNANIIFGSTVDESMKGKVRVSFVMTGLGRTYFGDLFKLLRRLF